jgi:signal transduction histidine kinase
VSRRMTSLVASTVAATSILLLAGSTVLWAVRVDEPLDVEGIVVFAAFIAFAVVGAVIVSKQPSNAIGRLFVAIGVSAGIALTADTWVRVVPPLPGRGVAGLIASVAFLWSFIPLTAVLLLFPHGTLPSPRWRIGIWLAVVAGVLIALGNALNPTLVDHPDVDNPIGVDWVKGTPLEGGGIGWLLSMIAFAVAAAGVVVRYRRSSTDERRRLKWLVAAAAFVGLGWVLQGVGYDIHSGAGAALKLAFYVSILVFPILVGIAIVRQRLFDIDVVINRTLVYGALAVFITGVYVAIVVGIGSLVGTGDEPNVALQVAATAVVAVAFQPVRQRVQRIANRLVFGERATPYEVMTDFADKIAGALSLDDVLPQIAEAAARGTGATSATVRLFGAEDSERAVTWPTDATAVPSGESTVDVMHGGERVGSITVAKRAGEDVSPTERALLADVAAQAGIALRNVRLTLALEDRLEQIERQADQLQRSRQRLVTARDIQRRRLERDIREGAQRQLERIGGRIREATELVQRDPGRAAGLLEEIEADTGAALEGLRDLARGIFPPLLADKGIAAAIEGHMRKLAVPGEISTAIDGVRFDAHVEAAVYFCCVQALQNAVRHARGSRVDVSIKRDGDEVLFAVRDDGEGFDPAQAPRGMGFDIMRDRVEALGGTLDVVSEPGRGTSVTGRVPARVVQAVAS